MKLKIGTVALMLVCHGAFAAGADHCHDDQAGCAEFESADAELNAIYQQVIARWANHTVDYPTKTIRESQRHWIRQRDLDCEAVYTTTHWHWRRHSGWRCKTEMTKARIKWLRARLVWQQQ